jgi:YD repeat-containing protein
MPYTGPGTAQPYLVRLSTREFAESGALLEGARRYYDIYSRYDPPGEPASDPGYDAWTIARDEAGRIVRVVDPTATITGLDYDVLDRITRVRRGTSESGPGALVDITTFQYDGGVAGGNSFLTHRFDHADDTRFTFYFHDYLGRVRVVRYSGLRGSDEGGPHWMVDYDNIGRPTAVGGYGGTGAALSPSLSPTTYTPDRMALQQIYYDERGQVYREVDWGVDPATGGTPSGPDGYIPTDIWRSPDGHPLLMTGETIQKFDYNRLCEPTASYLLASTGPISYPPLIGPGDLVLSEQHIGRDAAMGLPRLMAMIHRQPDQCGQPPAPGPLTPPGFMTPVINPVDPDLSLVSANIGDVSGLMQIYEERYDELDRPVQTTDIGCPFRELHPYACGA